MPPLDDAGQTPPAAAVAAQPAANAPSGGPDIRGLIDQSRQAGATDDQIRDLMVKAPFLADTWQASEKAGISPDAVFQHFGIAPPAQQQIGATEEPSPPQAGTDSQPSLGTIAGLREAMKPEPGWVASGILPIATKAGPDGEGDPEAGIKLDWGPIRSVVNPVLDLLEGTGQATSVGGPQAPLAGKVSPEATALLAGTMMGGGSAPAIAETPMARLQRQTADAILRKVGGDESRLTDADAARLATLRSQITQLPQAANVSAAPATDAASDAVAAIGNAPDIDSAIAAAGEAASAPVAPDFVPPGSNVPVLPRILSLINEDNRVAASRPDFVPPSSVTTPAGDVMPVQQPPNPLSTGPNQVLSAGDMTQVQREQAALAAMKARANGLPIQPDAPEAALADDTALMPQSAGAPASRQGTPPGVIAMAPDEFVANRLQGETERLAAPPSPNDTTVYIPGVQSTLAEVTGDPVAAMDQAYNRQQPEAMTQHVDRESKTADLVADYYADTAGSATTLLRMQRERDDRAAQNIQAIFGDPQSPRAPADPTPTLDVMQQILDNPRQAERDVIQKTIPNLMDRFYDDNGDLKTDPYALYGIGEHINDLLSGVGDTETSSSARVLKRELMQIRGSLYNDIEAAAPGFAQYRADYRADSQAIDAMKLLQDERLSLLNKDQHITPAKWFSFMRNTVEGRADPMDAASALSDDQMDRLWNITDQLKRSTFIDAGKPRGSWTSMMQEWGGKFAQLGAHLGALHYAPVVGNVAIGVANRALRARSVRKEMDRVLNPDLSKVGQ